jgi:hypothetical protein
MEDFANSIKKSGRKLVVYGYGVIGSMVAPHVLGLLQLENYLLFFCDRDETKHGELVRVGQREVAVVSSKAMAEVKEPFDILITGSHYDEILNDLSKKNYLENAKVYILPQMLAQRSKNLCKQRLTASESSFIPKKIHYCWFGSKEIPDELKKYMDSWKRYCPDYEIVRWSEENVDLDKYPYTSQAYKHRKWGYIPDVVRLEVLYNYGGIYLDTDVELLKPLDYLLGMKGFCATEKWGIVNVGGGCGVVPKHPMIGEMLDYRKDVLFEREDGTLNLESSGSYETKPLLEHGFVPDNTIQVINNLTILTSDFFHPFDYMTRETNITENTYAIHHFYGSWR